MTRAAATLLTVALTGVSGRAGAGVVWELMDVQARLDDDGRLHVVETHTVRTDAEALDREFGLGVDQSVSFHGLSRVADDGAVVPLEEGDPELADRYRAYPRHVRWSLLAAGARPGAEVRQVFRMQYELVNALSPAWDVAAGPDPLVREYGLASPFRRASEVVRDWGAAWPEAPSGAQRFAKRYRLDHDVLFPSRDGPGIEFRRMDYRLEYAKAWRMLDPDAELGTATDDRDYRVRKLFDHLGSGLPAGSSWRAAAARWVVVLGLPLVAALHFGVLWAFSAVRTLGLAREDPQRGRRRALSLAPEVIRAVWAGEKQAPTVEAFLARLAAEGKVEVETEPGRGDRPPAVRMTLSGGEPLSQYEGAVVDRLFPRGRDSGTEVLHQHYRDEGFDPQASIGAALEAALPAEGAAPRMPLANTWRRLLVLVAAVLLFREVSAHDRPLHALGIAAGFVLFASVWPRRWWLPARSPRQVVALLWPPLPVLAFLAFAPHLLANTPLGLDGTLGAGVAGLACSQAILNRSRMADGDPARTVSDLGALRRYALAELRRPRPRLEDRWVSRLEALGLGRALERWRRRHGRAAGPGAAVPSAGFTGCAPERFVAPAGWAASLWVDGDEGEEEEADTAKEA